MQGDDMRAAAVIGSVVVLVGCAPGAAAAQTQLEVVRATTEDGVLAPLPESRPVSAAELARRRQALHQQMGNGVLIVFGARAPASDDMHMHGLGHGVGLALHDPDV